MEGELSRESNFTISSPAFLLAVDEFGRSNLTFLGFSGGFLGLDVFEFGLKKDFTESIIPSPYICCLTYFPISGLYFFF